VEIVEKTLFFKKEAKFAGGTVGAEVVGEVKRGPGTGGDGGVGPKSTEREEAGGFIEAEAGAELAGGGPEDTTAEGGVEGAEAVEFDGDGGLAWGGADGSATASDGLAGKEELGEDAG
jgi:hypothetical protein